MRDDELMSLMAGDRISCRVHSEFCEVPTGITQGDEKYRMFASGYGGTMLEKVRRVQDRDRSVVRD